jgi:hypothetical protein
MAYAARKFLQLPVLNQNGRWLLRFRGKRVEFADRRSALREAILEAFEHSRNGTPTQVVSIDDHLTLEIVWTYGVDPDPAPVGAAQPADRGGSVGAAGSRPPRAARMPAH